ncbi:MAG TPA: hypothetical protein VFE47_08150 [Tepidisphaeraceae bacterium]|jgi:hypothetical protein|nr:hypothetical protein [Tepidisphaeraceae bacterium]
MPVPRPRSVFWIVSTHVVTILFLMFALLFVSSIAVLILKSLEIVSTVIGLCAPMISLILTTNYSLGNIRRVATIDNPMACFMPSMLAFCGLFLSLVAAMLFMDLREHTLNLPEAACFFAYSVALCIAFGLLTRRGLRKMQADVKPGFPVLLSNREAR